MSDIDLSVGAGVQLQPTSQPITLSLGAPVVLQHGQGVSLNVSPQSIGLTVSGGPGPPGVGVPTSSYWQAVLTRGDSYGVYGPNDLRYWAAQAGITLGTGNDQPAFDAAHAAMAAKPANQMLYVYVPPGLYLVDQGEIYSSAGFWCDVGAAMLRQKPQTTPKPIVVFGDLDDPVEEASTAASWLLWGFKIDGQFYLNWTNPAVVTGSASPSMPSSGAALTMNGQSIVFGTVSDLADVEAVINRCGVATGSITDNVLTLTAFTPSVAGALPDVGMPVTRGSTATTISGITTPWNGTTGVYAVSTTGDVGAGAFTIGSQAVLGVTASIASGALVLSYQGAGGFTIAGSALAPLGLTAGTTYGGVDETTPGLFHHAVTEYSGGDPDRTATIGQAGVYLRGAFGADAYSTTDGNPTSIAENSPFSTTGIPNRADGDARFLVGELDICCVAGDGFNLQGTGAGVIGPIRVSGAGGRGIVLNAYDNEVTVLEAGGTGFEGIVMRSQFSTSRFGLGKTFFSGLRANAGITAAGGQAQDAGHKNGLWMDQCGLVTATLEIQDSVGSGAKLSSILMCNLDLSVNWVGLPPAYQAAPCGGIDFVQTRYAMGQFGYAAKGGFIRLRLSVNFIQGTGPFRNVQYAVSTNNRLNYPRLEMVQTGLPGDDSTDFAAVNPAIQSAAAYWVLGAATLTASASPTLPGAGQTLVLNGTTVAFASAPADIQAVATAINAAAAPGVTAAVDPYLNQLVISAAATGAEPYSTLVLSGTACAGLGLTAGTYLGQAYYDTARMTFGTYEWGARVHVPNSAGYINWSVPLIGSDVGPGFTATSSGAAAMTAAGRGNQVQIGVFDPAINDFVYPYRAALDSSGNIQMGFFNLGTLVNQPYAEGLTNLPVAGSSGPLYANSATNGGLGAQNYTFADVVHALKVLNILKP